MLRYEFATGLQTEVTHSSDVLTTSTRTAGTMDCLIYFNALRWFMEETILY